MTDKEAILAAIVKPLDLSNLLKHAFIAGRISAGASSSFHGEAWSEYDPTESAAYARIAAALNLDAVAELPTRQIKGETLDELCLKVGDKIRPVGSASNPQVSIIDGPVWTFHHVASDGRYFGVKDHYPPDHKGTPLSSGDLWRIVERAPEATTANVEHIVAAAVQIEGITISLPQPARHSTVLACVSYTLDLKPGREVQGFLTSTGRFVNRIQARHIADIAGQKPGRSGGRDNPELFSEDLW